MRYFVLSVYDRAAASYGRPLFAAAVGAAMRSFQDEVNRAAEDNPMYKHPEDFDLVEIGVFDDQTAKLESVEPKVVCIGRQMSMSPPSAVPGREAQIAKHVYGVKGNGEDHVS